MAFWSDLGKGISTHIRGFEFIAKHNLWHFFIYPFLILALLFLGGYWSVLQLSDWLVDWLMKEIGIQVVNDNSWIHYLQVIGSFLVGIVLKIVFLLILSSYIKYIVLIICSPILALLSERVDEIISGKKYPFNFSQFIHDIFRGILVTLRNMAMETLLILACMIIGWIPVVGLITIPFLYLISWYFMGFSMMDYSYERTRMTIVQGARFTRKHKGIAIGNGFIFSMILLVPFIGVVIAPILSVVAATLAVLEKKKEETDHSQVPSQGISPQ
jgi:CysZ protein